MDLLIQSVPSGMDTSKVAPICKQSRKGPLPYQSGISHWRKENITIRSIVTDYSPTRQVRGRHPVWLWPHSPPKPLRENFRESTLQFGVTQSIQMGWREAFGLTTDTIQVQDPVAPNFPLKAQGPNPDQCAHNRQSGPLWPTGLRANIVQIQHWGACNLHRRHIEVLGSDEQETLGYRILQDDLFIK